MGEMKLVTNLTRSNQSKYNLQISGFSNSMADFLIMSTTSFPLPLMDPDKVSAYLHTGWAAFYGSAQQYPSILRLF